MTIEVEKRQKLLSNDEPTYNLILNENIVSTLYNLTREDLEQIVAKLTDVLQK